MKRPGGSVLWLALPIVAVVVFTLLLTVSLQRMIRIEADMRVEAEQNMLWVMHESEAAARRLREAALLAELDRAQEADIALRLDILRSRVALLNEGPQRRFVERIGLGEDLDQLTTRLETLAPQQMTPAQLQATLALFPPFFARAANKTMIAEWDELGERLESYRGQLQKTIVALIGVMAAGAVLTAALVLALRNSRQHNRMLRRARDFSGLLIASSGEGIAAVDATGQCTLWNEAMADLVGQPAQQAVGRSLSDVAGFFAIAAVRDRLADALAGEPGQLLLRPLFRDAGEVPIHVDLRAFPMRDETGIVGAILFMQDASDRHAAERRDAELRERLEQLVVERTRELDDALRRERSAADLYRNFAAMISHQFRTPLAIADSALQRLIRRGNRADANEMAERATRARSAIAGLTRLVESTLDAARIEAGEVGARRERCDLVPILADVCEQQRAATPDARIRVIVREYAPALCDPAYAEQVLKNLVSNAVTYAPGGSEVSVTLDLDCQGLHCEVTNGGAPIPLSDRARLFERNFRGANSTAAPGTGVGLFIARTLARMQGGDLVLLPGDGETVFRLTLPQAEGTAP